jgi:hypothetical protein
VCHLKNNQEKNYENLPNENVLFSFFVCEEHETDVRA